MYMVSEEQLRELLNGYLSYVALAKGGVDNWQWYGESFDEFIRQCQEDYSDPSMDFDDIVEEEMNNYAILEG